MDKTEDKNPKYKTIDGPIDRVHEEIGELLQAIGKAKRFGWQNYHPDRPQSSNYVEVQKEIDDVIRECENLRGFLRVAYRGFHVSGR